MKPKVTVIDRRSCRTSFYALTILLFLLATESCLPSSCGPGNLSDAPLISNLVDYTVPPSGIILRPSTFDTVSVYFLRWIDKNSFSIPSDLQLWLVDEGVEYDRHNPGTLLDATTVISNPQWPEFDPDDPQRTYCNPNDNNFCGRLDLSVDSTGMDPGLYLVRLKEGSLVSDEGHSLDDHADTLIRLVLDGAESDAPFVVQASVPKWDEVENPDPFKFLVPHKQLVFTFSEEMGFINNSPNLINGFNLVHDVEHSPTGPLRSVVKSESIQGFRPGTVYQLDFLSSDSMPNGVPYTMDLSGNALSDVGVLPEPSTTTYFFETSHVRILYPLNAPFTDDPFVWYYEGKPIITVDYSDEVAYVKCENVQDSATIRFNRKDVESGQSYMLIEANKIEQRVEGQLEHVLQVHAYGFNDEYLGHDKISVNTCPYPNYAEGVSPIADYVLPESIFVRIGDPSDLDLDMLNDEYEFQVARAFSPFMILDEDEHCMFPDQICGLLHVANETQVFWQVRPYDWTGKECRRAKGNERCAQYLKIIYQFTYQMDMFPTGSCWDSHAGDTEPVRMILRTNDNGKTWELSELTFGFHRYSWTFPKSILRSIRRETEYPFCEDLDIPECDYLLDICKDHEGGDHLVFHIGENKHSNYLFCGLCEEKPSLGYYLECQQDDCDGGQQLYAPIKRENNVGEPYATDPWTCNGAFFGPGIHLLSGELVSYGFYCEYLWEEEAQDNKFCGGMSASEYLYCRYYVDCVGLSEDQCEVKRDEECNYLEPWLCSTDRSECATALHNRWYDEPFCPCSE